MLCLCWLSQKLFRCLSFASLVTLLNTSVFSSVHVFTVRSGCGLLLAFYHNFIVALLSATAAWVSLFHQGGWMTAFCRDLVWVGLWVHSFDITSESDLPYWTDIRFSVLAHSLVSVDWRIRVGSARVSAHVSRASREGTSVKLIGFLCHPVKHQGVWRLPLIQEWRGRCYVLHLVHIPCCLVPCRSNKLDRALKSPHVVIVSSSSSSTSWKKSQLAPVVHVKGCFMHWWWW